MTVKDQTYATTDRAIYTRQYHLTAGETDARGLMPVTLVAARAIENATEHANLLGVGYSTLARHKMGWVLARLSIEMVRYPEINEEYSMTTWIEGYNRYFSDRCYEMTDAAGRPLAFIRSVWVAIDMDTRAMADLSGLDRECLPVIHRGTPLDKCRTPAIAADAPALEADYTFKYCDIDFNRHVNTIRYLDLVLNQRTLEFFDTHDVRTLEASFDHECHFGQHARLLTGPGVRNPRAEVTEIHVDGRRAVAVGLTFAPR